MKPFQVSVQSSQGEAVSPNTRFVIIEVQDKNGNATIDAGDTLHVEVASLDDGVDVETNVVLTAQHSQSAVHLAQIINGTLHQIGVKNKIAVATKENDLSVVGMSASTAIEQERVDL